MALKMYTDSACTNEITTSNYLTTQHILTGDTQTVQAYIKNDDSSKYYTTVSITPSDVTNTDESGWIQLSSDGTTYGTGGAALSLADFGSAGTPDNVVRSIYVKVITPDLTAQGTQNKTDIFLQVTGKEYAV